MTGSEAGGSEAGGSGAGGSDAAPEQASAASGRRIILWRHGRTDWNAGGRVQGQLDSQLDTVGWAQARRAAPSLAALRPARIACSDLSRARDTASVLAELTGLPLHEDKRLRESYLGEWQGFTLEETARRWPDEHAAWRRGDDVRRGGGETQAEVAERGVEALLEHLVDVPSGGLLVAVTHGAAARAMIGSLVAWPVEGWWRLGVLENCRWAELTEAVRGWRLARYGVGAEATA